MVTPQEVQQALDKANKYYVEMNDQDILNIIDGCCGCSGNSPTKCLYYIKKGLQYRQDVNLYDDTTDSLVRKINRLVNN